MKAPGPLPESSGERTRGRFVDSSISRSTGRHSRSGTTCPRSGASRSPSRRPLADNTRFHFPAPSPFSSNRLLRAGTIFRPSAASPSGKNHPFPPDNNHSPPAARHPHHPQALSGRQTLRKGDLLLRFLPAVLSYVPEPLSAPFLAPAPSVFLSFFIHKLPSFIRCPHSSLCLLIGSICFQFHSPCRLKVPGSISRQFLFRDPAACQSAYYNLLYPPMSFLHKNYNNFSVFYPLV